MALDQPARTGPEVGTLIALEPATSRILRGNNSAGDPIGGALSVSRLKHLLQSGPPGLYHTDKISADPLPCGPLVAKVGNRDRQSSSADEHRPRGISQATVNGMRRTVSPVVIGLVRPTGPCAA